MFLVESVGAENQVTFDMSKENRGLKDQPFTMLLPVPSHLISLNAEFSLVSEGKEVPAQYSIINAWPTNIDEHYIRLLSIGINNVSLPSNTFVLNWSVPDGLNRTLKKIKRHNYNAQQVKSNSQLVYPSLNWLSQSLLIHPKQNIALDWYVEPQKKYARYITDQLLLDKNGYAANKPSQWLYDRPQAIFQLYIMSGEQQWLTQGKRLSSFYQQHIDEEGLFTLKKRFDVKYLMPKGLLYDFLLSGSSQAKSALKKIYKASLAWDEHYSSRRGFWTERNQAAALNTAISYWEASNDEAALVRINNIIDATVEMTFNPQGDWSLRGCPQHSFKSHEGWGDNSPACSPWMMALLGDALWRFYQLTNDKRAAALIDAFGDFVFNYGLFYGDKRVKNIVIPKYIVSIENSEQEKLNQWSDPQHVCDVAGLLGKSVYIKNKSGSDSFLIQFLFSAFIEQCQQSYVRLKKEQNKNQNKPYWPLKPPRRFGWMYSTTSDLPWLNHLLGAEFE
ncbi:MAG: hypothetical protein QNK36_04160 [Colwellia sp.]|nr:hypothetical protein [Colwellia sp.]